mgnify:CR=1 FL=1
MRVTSESPDQRAEGFVVTFDDMTELVSAQRSTAWADVARRIAHEIKNPLTPIQLSAERLEKKLAGKLAPAEQAVVTKSVQTIVDQVDAMKRLVNEFRDYARLPAAELKPVDLNALVNDVLHLYAREGDPARGPSQVPVRVELDRSLLLELLGEPLPMTEPAVDRLVARGLVANLREASENAKEAIADFRGDKGPIRGVVGDLQQSLTAARETLRSVIKVCNTRMRWRSILSKSVRFSLISVAGVPSTSPRAHSTPDSSRGADRRSEPSSKSARSPSTGEAARPTYTA